MAVKAKKILLVDDSPIVRAVVIHALSAVGWNVAAIEEPTKLDDAILRETPDLLLVDATYPNVTDDVLIAIVLRHSKTRTVVLFSDRPESEVVALVKATGARGFVPKEGAILAERLKPFFAS